MPDVDDIPPRNTFEAIYRNVYKVIDTPVTWFRESIVKPNQQQYPYYHQRFRRVPTLDECYSDDILCRFEADEQFKRDKLVESEILVILKDKLKDCYNYESPDDSTKCKMIEVQYKKAEEAWFIKYGEMGIYSSSLNAFMKQKHRMLWERRHGPVGTGMKIKEETEDLH
uniref:NADH dehydrogenase [ubiquinone] 1 beta subcomplex subunit 10 n=1 Tax=Lynceus sp. MCZ IZ 141354 TaxID=1930659 RepID=A0A9N6WWF2_9CRUS|nr:EOG090X0LTN [Lynceus sp. MCZ IZ 141354]